MAKKVSALSESVSFFPQDRFDGHGDPDGIVISIPSGLSDYVLRGKSGNGE